MNSFYNYTQNNNCNQTLKKSIFFSLYNKNLDKKIYFKTSNSVKGFYKDSIINDVILLSSNGLKKNAIFRSTELQLKNNNFVSFFRNLEDQLQVFNLYPQKYNKEVLQNYLKHQSILFNWKSKSLEKKIKSTFFLKNYKLLKKKNNSPVDLDTKNIFFIKNLYDKYYFINENGFIKNLNGKSIQKNLFGGLTFILPKTIQISVQKIFLLNYYLINYYSNLEKSKTNNHELKLNNIIIYTLYLKFLNFKIFNYLKSNNIKIRKSNWLLYKYIKLYSGKFTKILNFFYNYNILKLNKLNLNKIINKALYSSPSTNFEIFKNVGNFSTFNVIKALLLNLNFYKSSNYQNLILNNNIFYKYVGFKLLLLKNIFNFTNFSQHFKNNRIINYYDIFINKINNLTPNNYLHYNGLINNLILLNNNTINSENLYFDRFFIQYKPTKNYVNFYKNKIETNYINYPQTTSRLELKQLKRSLGKFKRSFIRKRKNKKIIKKINKSFTLSSRNFKLAKLKKLKSPWLKLYNNVNSNK